MLYLSIHVLFFFFFNDTATTEIYTLSLHDALPISTATVPADPVPYRSSDAPHGGGRRPVPGRPAMRWRPGRGPHGKGPEPVPPTGRGRLDDRRSRQRTRRQHGRGHPGRRPGRRWWWPEARRVAAAGLAPVAGTA